MDRLAVSVGLHGAPKAVVRDFQFWCAGGVFDRGQMHSCSLELAGPTSAMLSRCHGHRMACRGVGFPSSEVLAQPLRIENKLSVKERMMLPHVARWSAVESGRTVLQHGCGQFRELEGQRERGVVQAARLMVMGMVDKSSEGGEELQPRMVPLTRWQLKRLAEAATQGRRHINVKRLAAETQLDRKDVLAWLKNPPDLSELGLELPTPASPSGKTLSPGSAKPQLSAPDFRGGRPDWTGHKRLRKEQIATLERVYTRSKYPDDEMMASLVQMTHLPRRKILDWFRERRDSTNTLSSQHSRSDGSVGGNDFGMVKEEGGAH